jgi:hypothetical protein
LSPAQYSVLCADLASTPTSLGASRIAAGDVPAGSAGCLESVLPGATAVGRQHRASSMTTAPVADEVEDDEGPEEDGVDCHPHCSVQFNL